MLIDTDDGSDGNSRDHATFNSPTFATYNLPLERSENPLRVSRIVCRLSLRDRNLGAPILRPFRFPDSESLRPHLRVRDHPPLHVGVRDPHPRRIRVLPSAQCIVEHHPCASERPGQHVLLTRRRIHAVAVSELHARTIQATTDTHRSRDRAIPAVNDRACAEDSAVSG